MERRVPLDEREKPLIRDRDQRVDVLAQFPRGSLRLPHALLALEVEGLRHDGHGQRARFRGELRDDRTGTRTGSAAETRG